MAGFTKAYRAAWNDFEKKQAIIERAIELAPLGAKRVRALLHKELLSETTVYQRRFYRQAQGIEETDIEKTLKSSAELAEARRQLERKGAWYNRLTDAILNPSEKGSEKPDEKLNATPAAETVPASNLGEAAVPSREKSPRTKRKVDAVEMIREKEHEAIYRVRLAQIDPQEAAAIVETNRRRRKKGLSLLQVDLGLCQAAADHSRDMRMHRFFSHRSPVPGKGTYRQRAQRFGAVAVAENLVYGARTGVDAVKMWISSHGHRANIMNERHRRIGVGRSGGHYTQLFGR